jgi:hypothetical protein
MLDHACSITQPNAHNRRQQEADGCRKENWRPLRIEAFTDGLKDFSHSTFSLHQSGCEERKPCVQLLPGLG